MHALCRILMSLLLMMPVWAWSQPCASDYSAARLTQGISPNIHPGVYFVEPPYAGFDPCHDSVDLTINRQSDTFVLVLHGGGGSDNSQSGVSRRFAQAGYSVLQFDAFRMNKLQRDNVFWMTAVHAGSTGRMLYFSGLAAINWLVKQHPERSQRIIVYGISTGATAAINLAGTEGLDAVTMVLAEGPNNAGIGFPDRLFKPVHVFYGARDNFGGSTPDEFLWKRRSSCLWNSPNLNMPAGNTALCSYARLTRGQQGQTVEEYVDEQKKKGAPITFELVEGAAHGIFNGRRIDTVVRATPSGIKLYLTTGSGPGVADTLFQRLLDRVQRRS